MWLHLSTPKNAKNGTIKITILCGLCMIIEDNLANVFRCLTLQTLNSFILQTILSHSFSLHKHTHTFGLLRFYEALTIFSAILYFEIVLSNLSCYSFSWMSIWWNIWRRPTTILPIIVCWTLNMLINQNDKIFKWCDFGFVKIFEQQT